MKSVIPIAFFLLTASFSKAQTPPPVSLGIQNILQQNQMWCWAAVAQQVILWSTGMTPQQCELVASAKYANPLVCCQNPQACSVPGQFVDIQGLLYNYGAGYSNLVLPANPMMLYNTLAANRAIILFLNKPYQNVGHFVVVTGMEWISDPYLGIVPIVYINDPMSVYTNPVPFNSLIGLWQAAIVTN
jgi:hypothetical protein